MTRYLSVVALIATIAALFAAVESSLRAVGAPISLFDTRGAGQVLMLSLALGGLAGYVRFVIGINPFGILLQYVAAWRRALKGLLHFYLAVSAIVIAVYVAYALKGDVYWSATAADAFSLHVAERTIVAILVVFVLALTEEIVFRLFLMGYLRFSEEVWPTIAAVVVAAAIFATAHNLTDPLAWLTPEQFPLFVGLWCLGVLLSVTYLSTGSFFCAIGVHAGFLGSKVFLRKTQILDFNPEALMLADSYDLRMSPIVWGIFLGLAFVIFLLRKRLRSHYVIEETIGGPIEKEYRTITDVLLRSPRQERG